VRAASEPGHQLQGEPRATAQECHTVGARHPVHVERDFLSCELAQSLCREVDGRSRESDAARAVPRAVRGGNGGDRSKVMGKDTSDRRDRCRRAAHSEIRSLVWSLVAKDDGSCGARPSGRARLAGSPRTAAAHEDRADRSCQGQALHSGRRLRAAIPASVFSTDGRLARRGYNSCTRQPDQARQGPAKITEDADGPETSSHARGLRADKRGVRCSASRR